MMTNVFFPELSEFRIGHALWSGEQTYFAELKPKPCITRRHRRPCRFQLLNEEIYTFLIRALYLLPRPNLRKVNVSTV
jgi:hypothetical protein